MEHMVMAENPNFVGRIVDVEPAVFFLRGWFIGRGMHESLKALGYMMTHHAGQKRSDGQPYIVHPLSMATHAAMVNDDNITDELVATLLLHDLREDAHVSISEMPFSGRIRNGVKYMSLIRFNDESKYELKKRYYN